MPFKEILCPPAPVPDASIMEFVAVVVIAAFAGSLELSA